jgi:hypothetical protein
MSDDIGFLAASKYAAGKSPIDVAEGSIVTLLTVHTNLLLRAAAGRKPLPAWQDLSFAALARKIVGELLDAGWEPPSDEDIRAAAEHLKGAS